MKHETKTGNNFLRSNSEVIRTQASFKNTKNSSPNFRRRSLVPKTILFEAQGFESIQQKSQQTVTELRFLADVVKRKLEPPAVSSLSEIPSSKLTHEYQYYDSIVSTLISQIRSRNSRQESASVSTPKENKFSSAQLIRIRRSPQKKQSKLIKINSNNEKAAFNFSLSGSDTVYERKITHFIEFLYKLNFSNGIYVDLSLSRPKYTYKVKVGLGNNGALIKSLLKRRFWLELVGSGQCHFSWTQLTDNSAHENQLAVKRQKELRCLPLSKKPKLLHSSPESQLLKILRKQQIFIANQWYERSDFGKLSCYTSTQISRVTNHLPVNCIIGAKRILFKVVDWYYREIISKDPFTVLPKTYSFQGDYSQTLKKFSSDVKKDHKVWIVKPGQNSNRGNGIKVMQTRQVLSFLARERTKQGRPYIVQQYIKPFLYNGRKFDIRHFLLLTSVNGWVKAYWYREGYIRTSSQKYDIDDLSDQMIHLTNDAVQKRGDRYGKYEPANKLSYSNFQRYLDNTYPHKHYNFQIQILQKMREITIDLIRASFQFVDPQRKSHNFELFGLDFYVSSKFKPYLIECNANPCLEVNCPILEKIIPGAVQHALRIGLDALLPPPSHYPPVSRYQLCDKALQKLKYELIFDEKIEGPAIRQRVRSCNPLDLSGIGLKPDQDLFEDDGQQLTEGVDID